MPNFNNLMQFVGDVEKTLPEFIEKNNIDPLVIAVIIMIIFSDNSEN